MSETVKIYRGAEVIHEFIAEDSFSRPWGLMSDNYINITLKAKENVSLLYGDYILLDGEKFTLFNTVNVTESDGIKEYPLTFYGEQYFANRCIVEDEGATTFSYFGGVSDHMALVKLAFDKYGLSRFTLGTIEENGSQLIEYDNTKGLDAINKICETFKMEWEFAGNIINIKKRVGVDTSYRFEYGKGKGAYSVSLQPIQNTSITTRVIAKGGTINLPKNYPSTDNPKRLNLGSEVLDRNTDKYGIIPEVMINEDIYPRLIDKKVLDVDIPADIENATTWKLKLDIPFDLAAQYAPDEKPEIKFQTGDLAGNSFEIVENSWNNTDKTLQIIVLDQGGYKLPSVNRQPRIGDEFVLLNILMPEDPYVIDATAELRKWGEEQLKIVSEPQFAPSVTVSPKYIKDNDIQLHPGDGIVVVAGGNEIHIRIQKITFPLVNKRQLTLELGNNVMYSYAEKIANDLQDITNEVQNIRRNVQIVDRRGWQIAKETNERLGGIEESAALIGTEGGQLTFSGMFQANVNSNPNSFLTSEGRLQHFIYKDNPAGGIWNIGAFNITLQENVLYNIYAKCNKSNSNGIIYVSKEKIDTEAETGYYYFFLGTISSIFEEARSITLVTGYTFITGGYLTGQVIQDAGQRLVIDLPNAKITAKNGATIEGSLKITSGSSGLSNLEEWAAAEKDIQDAQSTANTAKSDLDSYRNATNETLETLNAVTDDLQSQVDGNIMAWDGDYVPALSNYPANEWKTEKEKTRHKGDYFDRTFMQDGKKVTERYKFIQDNGVYQWLPIADSSSALALQEAREALGIAGTKAKLFYGDATPVSPYDINDAWWKTNGTILMSKAKRLEGYGQNTADWQVVNDTQVRLAQMSSDNVISMEEKATLRNEKSQIDKEFAKYQQDATKYGISVSALQNAYNALVNFLNNTVKIAEDTDFTFSGLAQQSQYNQLFADYYTARTDFANLIADKIAAGAVENIKVGGVNLLNNTSSDWIAAYNGRPSYGVDTAYFHELRNKELTYSGYIKGVNAQANLIGIEVQIHYTDGSEKYRMADTDSRGNFEVRCSNVISVDDKEIEFIHLYPLFRNGTVSGSIQIKQFQIELGNKETTWKPSLSDNEKQINTGKLFVRGTGRNNDVRAVVILNNNDQNMTIYHRGLNLITIDRIRLNVVDNLVYDTYEVLSDITALADKLNSLDSSVIAILVSYDSAANLGTDYSVLIQAIERCGGSGDSAPFAGRRIPYAFVGIPGIGKGNGIEVYTSDAANAPYAEISTQIINGIPVGMSNSASILARQTQSRLSDWASDSKISPAEKTGLKQQLAEIQATYINLHSEAERYNIVSAWTVYNNAYNLAVAALNKYTAASPEIINIESDYNNIAAYYNKEQELRANIESIATSFKIDKIIDTTGAEYDRNTYYPVVLQIKSQRRASIQIKSGLDYSKIIPSWATHERGFVCQCEWEANANGWGESFVNRYVYSFSYRFTQNQVTPIGSIGQMGHTNNEYIYVRGGGVYKFTTTNVLGISIKTSAFTSYGETIDLLKEVAKPAVDVDVAKQQAAEADKKAAEALLKANEANFLKDAFSKSEINFGNGVVLSGAVFVENAPGSKIASAGIAGYVPSGQTQYPMIFAGANGAVNANSAKIRFYADGHGALAGGNIAWNANGDATFTGLIRSAYNGDRFEISPETKSFRMISSANKLLSNLTFWTDDFGNSVSTFQMYNHAGGIFGANCSLHLSPLGLAIYDGINEDILLGNPIVLLTRNSFMIKDFGAKIRPSSSEAQRSKLGTIIADTGNVSNGYATLRIKIE